MTISNRPGTLAFRRRLIRLVLALCALLPSVAHAQYPKINLAVGYEVDAAWPKKPENIKWRYMTGVAVDKQDRIWTINAVDPPVQVYDRDGKLLDSWGTGQFTLPHYLRIDGEGNVWAADFRQHTIRKFTPKGELLLTLGVPNERGNDERHLNGPTDIAITPAGEIFVTDGYGNNRIIHFDKTGKFVKTWGKLGVGAGELSQPHSIVVDSKGRLYVAERNNCRIQIFDQNGKSLDQWRNLVNPWGLCMLPNDELIVCGSSPKRWTERGNLGNPPTDQLVMKFDTDGRVQELWTFPLARPDEMLPGHLDWVHGLGVDSQGNLYLSDVADDSPAHRLQKFTRLPADK
ncbi:MAG TPA: peptidyl-alpha-hydroxyglycine alpha-amidating lyase family protein [Planctomycetaceae bacterium]|nr:peptidyl-alpha-hydroxyglycine alpha-amidating lyase family protein [Planctomycetaceae bacterium]